MMRRAGRVVRKVHQTCAELCRPGVTTREIDDAGGRVIEACGGKGLFKGYNPSGKPGGEFPANLCISVNEVVVHGIGDGRMIEDGDIVSIDCGVEVEGWCGDAANTVLVGDVPADTRKLCEVTQQVLQIAVENIRPGRKWSQVARLMQRHAEQAGMSVVKDYVGHGIGRRMHEDPQVPNYYSKSRYWQDIDLKEGLVLAVEPMCNLGGAQTRVLTDGWTVVTADGKPSAHYEHTIAVTANGADVLTDGR